MTSNKRLRQFLSKMTIRKGVEYENPNSVRYIQPFIEKFGIDMSQFKITEGGWKHFNDFFYRHIIDGVRPISEPVGYFLQLYINIDINIMKLLCPSRITLLFVLVQLIVDC